MKSPYKLYGGALRPDALNLNERFGSALDQLYAAAPPEVQRELGLSSAYRSPEVQAALYNASDKSGRTVAAPGKSKHQAGLAADLYGFGMKSNPNVSQATRDWVHQNAAKYGLAFPMDYEPWHIQLAEQGPPMPAQTYDYTPEQRRNAIASIESAGSGDYGALGPLVARAGGAGPGPSDRAYGRYQIMGSNIGPWAQQYLQQAGVTPEAFLKDPALQDKLFDAVFSDYVRKYGEENAAQAWFGGPGSIGKTDVKDRLGTSVGDYGKRYLAALGAPGVSTPAKAAPAQPAAPARDSKDPYASSIADALGGLGDAFGSYKSVTTPIAPPQATSTGGEVMPMISENPMDAVRRDQLARLMQSYGIV